MDEQGSLDHTKRECKYHAVSIPKCRRKILYKELQRHLGEVFRQVGGTEGESDRRRAFDAGPCAVDDCNSAEACDLAIGWLYQGEERNPSGAGVR
jgi:hypothetical protein